MNVLVRTHIQTTAKEQGSSLVLSHSIQAHSTLIFTHLSPRHTQVHKKIWANVNKHAHTRACTESYPALFLAVPLPSPDLHHSMNKAAERWRKWAHIGKRKGGGVVSGAERWGCGEGEERQRETHTLWQKRTASPPSPRREMIVSVLSADLTCNNAPRGGSRGRFPNTGDAGP